MNSLDSIIFLVNSHQFLGTTLLGITAQMTGNSLDGVFSLIILFLIGSVLLFFVKLPTQKGLENEG